MSFPRLSRTQSLMLFLAAWFLLNVLQAVFTELADDEAYYWTWSQFPALGYFDHPPMIAYFIRIGTTLIPGELGVRLATICASTATLYLIYLLVDRKDLWLLAALSFSTLLVNIGGFFVAPDTPLIFFVALFLYGVQRFLRKESWQWVLLIAVAAAGAMYSKYTGILPLTFAVMFAPVLWRRPRFWIAVLVAVALYIPYLNWLYHAELTSIQYHLVGRFSNPWSLEKLVQFVGGQLLVTGPLIGFITLYAAFNYRASDTYSRMMKGIMIGVFAFFLVNSLRGHSEPNWTAPAFIPLLWLAHKHISARPAWRKWAIRIAIPSIALLLLFRIHLAHEIKLFTLKYDKTKEFRGWEQWTEEVLDMAGDYNLVADRYQMAAKLSFYSGKTVPKLGWLTRVDQYDVWRFEKSLLGQQVAYLSSNLAEDLPSTVSPFGRTFRMIKTDNFYDYSHVRITPLDTPVVVQAEAVHEIGFLVHCPYDYPLYAGTNDILLRAFNAAQEHTVRQAWPLPRNLSDGDTISISINAPSSGVYASECYPVTREFMEWYSWETWRMIVE